MKEISNAVAAMLRSNYSLEQIAEIYGLSVDEITRTAREANLIPAEPAPREIVKTEPPAQQSNTRPAIPEKRKGRIRPTTKNGIRGGK